MIDISEERALELYNKISIDFANGKVITQGEMNELVDGKVNLFSVLISILFGVSHYHTITVKQSNDLTILLFQHLIPEYHKLVVEEKDIKIAQLEEEMDNLRGIILNTGPWAEVDKKENDGD